ncbi:Copper-exporting P-type ATPase B [Candidatus Burarchaeum australiense]|nr:Copper-exporting P-type ATPase B [Candidatus Burarchaeum australiense]
MFHSKTAEETLGGLDSREAGLGEGEAEARLRKYGYNEFGKGKRRGLLEIFAEQFRNYILLLLIAAAALAYLIGNHHDAAAIGIVVVLNVLFGMALEYRADRSMDELRKLAETKAVVLRNGRKYFIESRLLVPGDVIFLQEGMKIPADARLLEEHGLEVNEAALTGESMPSRKDVVKVALDAPLAERSCMAYAGTLVARGSAMAAVVATGPGTEFGKIEKTLGAIREESTTLEKTLGELGKTLTLASFAIVAALFAMGILLGNWSVPSLLIYSISIAVAAVPEGMLTVLTIVLAIGVKNMANEKALVRRLGAVETLGNITFIATDKTGTITEGRMALVKAYDGKVRDFSELSGTEKMLSYVYLCNSAHLTEEGVVGDETDRALLIAGIVKGVDVRRFRQITPQLAYNPFDPGTKTMSGIYEIGGKKIAVVKGAPESVLEMCSDMEGAGELNARRRAEVGRALDALAGEGMRMIGVACGKPHGGKVPGQGLTFLGMLALHDPVRREVKDTIKVCRQAGIRVLMMTGDNVSTAERISREIGLADGRGVATWAELEHLGDQELDARLREISVVARATPASKLRIVERLVKWGEIVAVTGDGVNDAPALKKAHVGVVMGRTGTDVSKEVADLVLMDDNFATLEKAIEYGRGITTNIINFLRFQITTNVALVMLSIPFVLGLRVLEPVHILWINLIIDGPPALTLGLEKPGKELMKERAVKRTTFIDFDFIVRVLNMGFYMAATSMVVFFYYSKAAPEKAVTMVFCTFALMQAFNALNSRSKTAHFYSNLSSNRLLVLAVLGVIAMQFAIVLLEPLRALFSTVPVSGTDFMVMLAVSGSVLLVGEAGKMFAKR